jgi:hypothetical protein
MGERRMCKHEYGEIRSTYRNHLEDLGVDGRRVLRAWMGLIYLRIRKSGGLL